MKASTLLLLFIMLTLPSLQAQDKDDAEAVKHIESFLIDHCPRINDKPIYDDVKTGSFHFLVETVTNDSTHTGIYICAWGCSHICRHYIMVIDFLHQVYKAYGQNDLKTDLVELQEYFYKNDSFKAETKLNCYDHLIGNYYYINKEAIRLEPMLEKTHPAIDLSGRGQKH